MHFFSRLSVVITTTVFTFSVQAAPVTWTLKDVTFDDGGTASGSFVYDVSTNSYSDISIIAKDFMTFGRYDDLDENPFNWLQQDFDLGNGTHVEMSRWTFNTDGRSLCYLQWGCKRQIVMDFLAPLTDAGGSISLTLDAVANEIVFSNSTSPGLVERHFLGGLIEASPASVPLPQAIWLSGSALGLLGWARRKR